MDIGRINKFVEVDHASVEGWFFPLDQVAFFEVLVAQGQLGAGGDLVEVGVYHGKSLVFLSLLKRTSEKLLGFDLFDAEHQEIAQSNLDAYGMPEGVTLVKGLTSEISREQLDSLLPVPLRFLHIDAGHEYHEVLEQLQIFSPYLGDSGIIAMDDYQDREFPGIEAAVLDFAEQDRPRRFIPFLAGGNKLFMCLTHMAAPLQQLLLTRESFKDNCRLTRVRDFNILIMRSKLPVASKQIIGQLGGLSFPKRPEATLSLNSKSAKFSQLTFGSGQ